MNDDPFYFLPNRPPPPPRQPKAGERLWEVRRNDVAWTTDVRFADESYGWDVRLRRNGELTLSCRFRLREQAIQWSEEQRRDIERG